MEKLEKENNNSPIVVSAASNPSGRDYVMGDLHGCIALLERALREADFDVTRDRLFSCGDLIDRGPASMDCLRLLREPWFFAVRGNHEDMLLSAYYRHDSVYHGKSSLYHNGGTWEQQLSADERRELRDDLIPRLLATPYIRTVNAESGEALFHVAHAELMLPPGADEDLSEGGECAYLTDNDIARMAQDPDCVIDSESEQLRRMQASLTWGRRVVQGFRRSNDGRAILCPAEASRRPDGLAASSEPWQEGLTLTFVGHTILGNLCLHASHLFIDRGAYLSLEDDDMRLSLFDALKMKSWLGATFHRETESRTAV